MVWVIILLILGLLGYWFYKMFYSEEAKAKEAAAEKRRQEQRNQQIEYYCSTSLVTKVAERISADINRSINNADRRAHIENIKVTYEYTVFDDCISQPYSSLSKGEILVDFERERIENLRWSEEKKLVGIAIFRLVKNNIRDEHPKDPGGLDYSIKYSSNMHSVQVGKGRYNEKTRQMVYAHDYGERFEIIYSCRNGYYRPKTKL